MISSYILEGVKDRASIMEMTTEGQPFQVLVYGTKPTFVLATKGKEKCYEEGRGFTSNTSK